jgi:hypothetical protein
MGVQEVKGREPVAVLVVLLRPVTTSEDTELLAHRGQAAGDLVQAAGLLCRAGRSQFTNVRLRLDEQPLVLSTDCYRLPYPAPMLLMSPPRKAT